LLNRLPDRNITYSLELAPAYTAAKHGVVGFTTALGFDLRSKNIHVNAVAPGFSDTPMVRAGRAHNTKFDQVLSNSKLVPVESVVDAMMQCITDDTLYGDGM
jgi:15-hydroxyprostaglandin dehydrogenase (NAD)